MACQGFRAAVEKKTGGGQPLFAITSRCILDNPSIPAYNEGTIMAEENLLREEPHSMTFTTDWLSDPTVFAVNRLPAVSDHAIYRSVQEADAEASSLVMSLDGVWKAHFALCPKDAPGALLTGDSLDGTLRPITVPGEFQIQNPQWDPPHYVNTQYPWDGLEPLVQPQVSDTYNPTVLSLIHI